MRTLFGIAIIAVALVITTWSVEPTVGKTPTVSVDPLGLMATTAIYRKRITKISAPFTNRSRGLDHRSSGWLSCALVVLPDRGNFLHGVITCNISPACCGVCVNGDHTRCLGFISPPLSTPSAHPVMARSNGRRRCSGPALGHRCRSAPASRSMARRKTDRYSRCY